MAEEKKRQKRWKLIINIVTILALVGLVYAVRDEIRETINNIGRVNTWALALMIPLQFINYDTMTRMYQDLFSILGHALRYKRLLGVTIELNFVNNVFPSGGVSGFSYFGLRMRSLGVSAGQATLVQAMRFILLFVSFQVLLGLGLLILAIEGKAGGLMLLIAGSLATLLLVGTLVVGFIIGSKKRINSFFTFITRIVNRIIAKVKPSKPEAINIGRVEKLFSELHESYMIVKNKPSLLKMPLWYSLIANIAEVGTVYVVFVAFGMYVNPGAVILAYAIANFAGLISVLPGGVGIYEALMTAVLASAGIPAGNSIPVIIMYRILSMTLQLVPGYVLYHRAVRSNTLRP